MTAAAALLNRLKAAGLSVQNTNGNLDIRGPQSAINAMPVEQLRAHKAEILALLSRNTAEHPEHRQAAGPIETWVAPSPLPLSSDEGAARITGWIEAMDRLPKSCSAEGERLKALTIEFALGVWSWPCVQSRWSDLALFHFTRGLIPEMSR
jgi:hypothetical protein